MGIDAVPETKTRPTVDFKQQAHIRCCEHAEIVIYSEAVFEKKA